jgi:phosphohistidine phosphatase
VKFYLQRHAEAESGMQMDPTRELTETGHQQAKLMAKWIKRQGIKPDLLLQSNFKRSQQTAKRVEHRLDIEPITTHLLDPDTDPEICWDGIKAYGKDVVLAVTHGPLVEKMLAYLTGSPLPRQFHFEHGAIAHFTTTTGKRGVMHWLVTPNVVARDEDEQDLVTSDVTRTVEAALDLVEAVFVGVE